jgi:hypothetical protein
MTATPVRLHWAIKPSFVAYVEALPDGAVEVLDGASRDAQGSFVFPAVPGETDRFSGAVHFRGHLGVLDVTFGEPRVEQRPGGVQLTVAVGAERVAFATASSLEPHGDGGVASSALEATDDATHLLGGVYPPGTALEPFQITGIAA